MPPPLGFAIIGCGMIARFHVRAIQEIPDARVAALVSRSHASAAKLIDETGIAACPVFIDVQTAVKAPGVDAVIITTPSGAHLEPALLAAAAGKHVVVEKPLEITGPRCQEIIDACDRAKVRLCTIFPSRFGDANGALKAAVDAGKFGRLTLGETACKWWRSQAYYDEGGWKGTQALDGGGAMMNQAIHNVDLLLWLMGPAASVSGFTATLAHDRIEVEDTAVSVIRFQSGALGVIQATTSVHPGYPKTVAIHGDKGSAVIEQDDVMKWDFDPSTPTDDEVKARLAAPRAGGVSHLSPPGAGGVSPLSTKSGGAADPKAISHEGHRRQLADFVAAVRENRPPKVDGREGKRSVDLICAVYESNRTGRAVVIPAS